MPTRLPQHKLSAFKVPHDGANDNVLIEQVFRASKSWGITIIDPAQLAHQQANGLTAHYNHNSVEDHENISIQRRRIVEWRAVATTDPSACHNLAIALFRGEMGVEKNPTEAAKYFTMAARMGNVNSAFNLGWQYANANGVKQSWTNAVKWWIFAAEGNHSSAARNIGLLYSLGMVPADFPQSALGAVSTSGTTIEAAPNDIANAANRNKPNYERAFYWYTKAYELNNWKAAAAIANMYRLGQYVDKDEDKAAAYDQLSLDLQQKAQTQSQDVVN